MKGLLSNTPVTELNEDTDYFGLLTKGKYIKQFLVNSLPEEGESLKFKMLCIYGGWGSGKSTLMHYLKNELAASYNCYFFESWEYEKDENLAYSLLEFFTLSAYSDKAINNLLLLGKRLLKGLGKSISLTVSNGPVSVEFEGSKIVEELEKKEKVSFHGALKEFKKEFKAIENRKNKGQKYNIVFIDDLDRCEPDQILNLLSAIKLFFTYGEKTIFFCGIDRSAVEAAVMHRYGNHIKASEYLEKIFDFSFTMSNDFDLSKFVKLYFNDKVIVFAGMQVRMNDLITEFFKEIKFTTPRRLKKVMNNFSLFRLFLASNPNHDTPNIDLNNGRVSEPFQTILCLYLIILKEFYQVEFDNFLNFDRKREVYFKKSTDQNHRSQITQFINDNFAKTSFQAIYKSTENDLTKKLKFFICLSPLNVESITRDALTEHGYQNLTVHTETIDFLFYKYASQYTAMNLVANSESAASFYSIKKIIAEFL